MKVYNNGLQESLQNVALRTTIKDTHGFIQDLWEAFGQFACRKDFPELYTQHDNYTAEVGPLVDRMESLPTTLDFPDGPVSEEQPPGLTPPTTGQARNQEAEDMGYRMFHTRRTHELKIDEPYLEAKLNGSKLFEVRINDRGYQKGDLVVYKQYGHNPNDWKTHIFEITYVTNYMQEGNYVVFGEKFLGTEQPNKKKRKEPRQYGHIT